MGSGHAAGRRPLRAGHPTGPAAVAVLREALSPEPDHGPLWLVCNAPFIAHQPEGRQGGERALRARGCAAPPSLVRWRCTTFQWRGVAMAPA